MFYDVFENLCKTHGVKPNTVTKAIGLSTATSTNWKTSGRVPSGDALIKVAEYFGVSVDYLLEREQDTKKEPAPEIRDKLDEDIWNAITQIPDEKREEALRYLQYLASQSEQ